MKKILFTFALVFSTAIYSNIFGQQAAPPGAGDKDLRDNNVKARSIDLERVDRDSRKTNQAGTDSVVGKETEDQLAARFGEIKTDFEQIQMSQDSIIKAYQGSITVDYAQISKFALEINKSAMRLDLNLFPSMTAENDDSQKEEKNNEKVKTEVKQAKSVRDLIVELDNSIGVFATSSMFQNLRLIDPKVSMKTRLELGKIKQLSAELNQEADKMTKGGK